MVDVEREAAEAANSAVVRDFGLLVDAASRLEQRIDAALRAECGVHHTMFEVLIRLCREPGERVSQRTLGAELVLTSGGTTRLVDRMEEAGLVSRHATAEDRRVTTVAATDKGRAVFVEAAAVHARVVEQYFVAPVAADDYPALVRALSSVSEAARRRT